MDDSLFEDKKFDDSKFEDKKFDDSLFEDVPAPKPDYSKQDVSQPEAFGVGAIQGSTLGTAPIASGIGGFLSNAVEQIGDKLGLTTDSQLSEGIDTADDLPSLSPELRAKLGNKTEKFTLPQKKTGMEGLLAEYYDSRERMKGLQNAAAEQHPWTTIAGNVISSLPAAAATGVRVASNAGTLAKMAAGAKEGAALGAITGFGSGDAELLNGEIGDTIKETAGSSIGGAAFGAAIPGAIGAAKGAANIVKELPIVQQAGTAFKGGRAGMSLNQDSAEQAIKVYSEDLLNKIRTQFQKAGLTKANALEYADEIGVRVNAGESFQDVIDEMIQRGASSADDQAEKLKLLKTFNELKNGPASKIADKLDLNRAKMQQKMEAKGFNLLDEQVSEGNVQDYIPGSGSDKNLNLAKQTYQKIDENTDDILEAATGKTVSKPVEKLIQQAGDELPIDINKYDLDNLTLKEVEDVISEINRHTGDLAGPAKTSSEKTARKLAAELRGLSENALETAGQTSGNKSLHKTFAALNRAGIDDNVLTNNQIRKEEMVDKLRNTITAGNGIDRDRMFQYLNEASPQGYKGAKEAADFLNDFNTLAKQVKPLNSTNSLGLLGSAKSMGLSAANKAGAGFQAMAKLTEMPVEKLTQLGQKLGTMTNSKAAQQYAGPLLKAAQMTNDSKRTAILYGLYQQPGFRDLYQSLGDEVTDLVLPVGTDKETSN